MDLYRVIRVNRNAWVNIRIMRSAYSGVFHRYCESSCDERAAIAKPAMDRVRTVFVTVFCIAVASPC